LEIIIAPGEESRRGKTIVKEELVPTKKKKKNESKIEDTTQIANDIENIHRTGCASGGSIKRDN